MRNFKPICACRAIAAALLVLVSACMSNYPNTAANSVLYQGARLIIGNGNVIENGALLIQDQEIVAAGTLADMTVPDDAMVVDVSGKSIIPALIDAHTHLGYEGYSSWGGDNYRRENIVEHLQRYAYYGFVAVFSAGSDAEDLIYEIQQQQMAGEFTGARVLFAAGMAPPGQGPNPAFLTQALTVAERFEQTVLRGVASPQQAREQVQEVAAKNIPIIKIWVDDRGGSQEKLSPEIYRALIEEAKALDIAVFVHQQSAQDMPDLIDAGAAGFLHGRLSPELDVAIAEQLALSNAFVVPNLGLGDLRREKISNDLFLTSAISQSEGTRLATQFELRNGSVEAIALNPNQETQLRDAFSRLLQAGVDIVLGTDAGAVPDHFFGYTGHRELEIYVRLGLTPMQAIIAGTSAAAEHLGMADLGSLESGKSANFIVLENNPLEDIRHTQTIVEVVLNGQKVDRESLRAQWIDP